MTLLLGFRFATRHLLCSTSYYVASYVHRGRVLPNYECEDRKNGREYKGTRKAPGYTYAELRPESTYRTNFIGQHSFGNLFLFMLPELLPDIVGIN